MLSDQEKAEIRERSEEVLYGTDVECFMYYQISPRREATND